jgi:hypothetical protein
MKNINWEDIFYIVFGILLGCAICAPLYFGIMNAIKTDFAPPPKFEVVDKYKSCDVVRYNPSSIETYKFFLDCSK